ncbi:structural maintenance of chromosomes protein 2 [Anabrus simplex]|uniref:structural maintenance of chromosomes protein 2 n=1 Tax=Anabrus simplex TaxID=316456 RepID=UPI0035A35038
MYIKSMVIEGFKSYGKRQEINGFDREFNAITGLNGSGKSNILDAICFVLGISNLTHVRAGSLQELVYKNGQAGITKASVTITFDNRKTEVSPLGYEQFEEITVTRQVVVGGKNKYLINGTNVQNKRVQDLFCSVQLNVNNPHFLIMQGRITKVLNMKPLEILSMIEEAAGTRMYESKKQLAESTIVKKDAKLKELNDVINEEIAPKIQKLKDEQVHYMEYQKVCRDLERMTKTYIAWKYVTALKSVEQAKAKVEECCAKVEECNNKIIAGQKEAEEIDKRVEELTRIREKDSGGQLQELEKVLKEKERHDAQLQSKLKGLRESITSEEKKLKHLEKNLKDDQNALAAKEAELKKTEGMFQKLRDADEADRVALEAAQQKLRDVTSGLLSNEYGEAASLQDQLMTAKQEVAQAQTEKKQAEMQMEHCKKELQVKQKEMTRTAKDFEKDQKDLDRIEEELAAAQRDISKLNYEDGQLESLQEQKKQLTRDINKLQDEIDRFEARCPQCNFRYKDPTPNFDRSRVHGVVCNLHQLKDPNMAAALQAAAGGKLFNVIADTEVTSKLLIEKGNLQQRRTMIPLNKIIGHKLDDMTIKLAQDLVGKENITPAISLVNFEERHRVAMEYVYGPTFICPNMNVAKQVAFHPRIMKKCITYDGDIADPAGTLSGGAPEQGEPVMLMVRQLNNYKEELQQKERTLEKLNRDIAHFSKVARDYAILKQKLDTKTFELELVRKKLQQTAHYQYKEEVDNLTSTIEQLKEKIKQCQKTLDEANPKVKKLEDKVKNAKEIREKEMKAAEDEVQRLTKKAEQSSNQWKQKEETFEVLNLEIKDLQTAVETGLKQIEEAKAGIEQLKTDADNLKEEMKASEAEVKEAKSSVKKQKEEINKKDKEIQQALSRKEKIESEKQELELEIKNLKYQASKLDNEGKDGQARVRDLSKNKWIETEKEYFGQPKGAYDFNSMDMNQTEKTIRKLEEQKESMGQKLNLRALNMLGKEEEQYAELLKKKRTVENDKTKLMAVIHELDEKKKDAVRKAWEQVNKDFGSIFASLLPGAVARLSPPEGKDVLDGLEVKVGFGDTWKESLGELSGGQRSLVALSLILSMLLFKPAPIYILDEVDAALDLSHTQNIGNMLKKHFKASQFIVVSLKDGMFNNANVLFRTEFVDGMSTVRRNVLRN